MRRKQKISLLVVCQLDKTSKKLFRQHRSRSCSDSHQSGHHTRMKRRVGCRRLRHHRGLAVPTPRQRTSPLRHDAFHHRTQQKHAGRPHIHTEFTRWRYLGIPAWCDHVAALGRDEVERFCEVERICDVICRFLKRIEIVRRS